jgi:hypothetical protein
LPDHLYRLQQAGRCETGYGREVTASVKNEQVLCLPLQMVDIGALRELLHENLRARNADAPQIRLHKGLDVSSRRQVGSTLPAGPGAACTA